MQSLRFYLAKEIQLPVWENNEMTGETETRITVIFQEATVARGGFARNRYGSYIAVKGTTLEMIHEDFTTDEDLSGEFALQEREGSDFCKVVAL